jgi:hypothetical protein
VPVEEPSTASIADIVERGGNVRFVPIADIMLVAVVEVVRALFRASTDVFGGDMLNFYNALERNLRQLVGFFDTLGRWRVE